MYLLSRLLAARECYYAVKCLVFKTLIRKETEATLFCFYSRRKGFWFPFFSALAVVNLSL